MSLFGEDDAPPDRERWAEHSADFTPRPVIRQGGRAAVEILQIASASVPRPRTIWDPCAGAGAFAAELRNLPAFAGARWVATEMRPEEEPHLRRHYDEVIIGDACEVTRLQIGAPIDLTITNPAWSTTWPKVLRHAVELGSRHVVFLGPISWGSSNEAAEALDVLRDIRPTALARIPGRIRFRTGINPRTNARYSADNRKCGWWMFDVLSPPPLVQIAAEDGSSQLCPRWDDIVLPELPKGDREWSVRPGTEGAT